MMSHFPSGKYYYMPDRNPVSRVHSLDLYLTFWRKFVVAFVVCLLLTLIVITSITTMTVICTDLGRNILYLLEHGK